MGYTTDFSGTFQLNKSLSPEMHDFLVRLNETRRMHRKLEDKYGVQGEFYVDGGGSFGQDHESNIVDYNQQPSTQPGLWCQWTPTDDSCGIEWDGGEKFYNYTEWLVYLIHKILAPNGYVLNGVVTWQGEETGDVGEIFVEDNKVFIQEWKGSKEEVKPSEEMRTDIVFIINKDENESTTQSQVYANPTQDQVVDVIIKNANPKMQGIDLEVFRNAFEGKVYQELVKLFRGEN